MLDTNITNISVGTQFTVQNPGDYRFGHTYEIKGFNADRGGMRYAICDDVQDTSSIKSSHIFYIYDLIS